MTVGIKINTIKEVIIPDSVTIIGSGAFSGCRGLTSITIPDSVTSIDWDAFSGCDGLASIIIGSRVTILGNSVFSYCSALTSVKFNGTVEQWDAITKGGSWNSGCPFTEVVCSNGTVSV